MKHSYILNNLEDVNIMENINNFEENLYISEDEEENIDDIVDKIIYIENQIDLFDEMVNVLWEEVMVKHIEDGYILRGLTLLDKHKFYKFMLKNSKAMYKLQTIYNNLNKKLKKINKDY